MRRAVKTLLRFRRNRDVVGINGRDRHLIAELNPRPHRKLADDKVLAKARLSEHGVPVPKTLAVIEEPRQIAPTMNSLDAHDHFVIKPACGRAGAGIAVLGPRQEHRVWWGTGGDPWNEGDIRRRVGNILFGDYARRISDRALIEERLFPGSVLDDIPVTGLPDIRVITLDTKPVMAMLRLPTEASSGKANLHLGAIGLGIDLETGRTTSATCRNRRIERHPENDRPLTGIRVTAWDEVLHSSIKAAAAFPLRYLGVDVSIDDQLQPQVLEVNVRPGLEIQNANGRGLAPELTRALAGTTGGGK